MQRKKQRSHLEALFQLSFLLSSPLFIFSHLLFPLSSVLLLLFLFSGPLEFVAHPLMLDNMTHNRLIHVSSHTSIQFTQNQPCNVQQTCLSLLLKAEAANREPSAVRVSVTEKLAAVLIFFKRKECKLLLSTRGRERDLRDKSPAPGGSTSDFGH